MPPPELTLSFFIEDGDTDTAASLSSPWEEPESRVFPVGLIKLNPFSIGPGSQRVGKGQVEVEISYTPKEISPLGTWRVWSVREEIAGEHSLIYVDKKDTGRCYGMEVIDIPSVQGLGDDININVAPDLCLRSGIQHPFIAPLKLAFVSSDCRLKLLAPLASGGYLFDHVQRERRLSTSQGRFYTAELVYIVEYLHGRNIILGSLKLDNILLDSSGHVSLCKPSLFGLDPGDGDCILHGTSQYSAPEDLLNGRATSRAGDWWSLGVILYELLTGMPPFYHKIISEQRRMILREDLQLPASLTSSARDILSKLLNKDPMHRFGVNGAVEVKTHPFSMMSSGMDAFGNMELASSHMMLM